MSTASSNTVSWPWGKAPPPESVHRQRIKSHLFRGDTYPPNTVPGRPITTAYFRFSGMGPPPHDIGRPGDVYVDNLSESLALYGRDQTNWSIWPGPGLLFRHPTLDDRYLWCSEERIAWYPGKFVVDDARTRAGKSTTEMIQQALKSEGEGCGDDDTESQRQRRSEKLMEEQNRSGKRTSSDMTASDDSEPPKRLKVQHNGDSNGGETPCGQDEEEAEDSDSLEYLSPADDEGGQGDHQREILLDDERPGWWLEAIAQICTRCPGAEARASTLEGEKRILEATIRVFEGRCVKEEQERRRLTDLCEKLKAEKRVEDDSEKLAAENPKLDASHNVTKEMETLGQNLSTLKRKSEEDEKARLELQGKNERQEQQINALLAEISTMKSLQGRVTRDTGANIETLLDGLPGMSGQTLGAHIKALLAIGQESAFASKVAEDAQQKISLMEEHISKVTSERDEALLSTETIQNKYIEMQQTLKKLIGL